MQCAHSYGRTLAQYFHSAIRGRDLVARVGRETNTSVMSQRKIWLASAQPSDSTQVNLLLL